VEVTGSDKHTYVQYCIIDITVKHKLVFVVVFITAVKRFITQVPKIKEKSFEKKFFRLIPLLRHWHCF
jgi:hypothetical protein